ncbi:DUF3078 domain-containing protein [Bacteroides sp. OttesenSCG-928-D19]|nr:DUF3078 domain-containing protein [Bacteroides sp. OttesenSCG-928-D19]
MKSFCTLLAFILFINLQAAAQTTAVPTDTIQHSDLYLNYLAQIDSLQSAPLWLRPLTPKNEYFKLFVPFTYYHSVVYERSNVTWKSPEAESQQEISPQLTLVDTLKFTQIARSRKQVNDILLLAYKRFPQLVVNNEAQIMSKELVKVDLPAKAPSNNPIARLFSPDKPDEKVKGTEVVIQKPNFWVTGGSGSFQMSQNEVSDNWYKGGESTNSLQTNVKLFANYNDKEKIQFETSLEAKVGFNSVSSDTVRKYRVNSDLLRLYSKLGVQAASKWYYTLSGEFNTQFFKNFKANSNDVVSSFMAPANLILSVGMDYKLSNKKINLSIFISPLAYNLRYVGNDKVDETKFGLTKGEDMLHDFGSKLQTTLSWKIIPSITYDSRLYYFTNYDKVEAEWENSFNFILNRYLSTKLFVHTRFDDGVKRVEGKSFFQFNEYLSFGINYNW